MKQAGYPLSPIEETSYGVLLEAQLIICPLGSNRDSFIEKSRLKHKCKISLNHHRSHFASLTKYKF